MCQNVCFFNAMLHTALLPILIFLFYVRAQMFPKPNSCVMNARFLLARSKVKLYPLPLLSLSTDVCCQVDSSCKMSETKNHPSGTTYTDPNQPPCNHSVTSRHPQNPTRTIAVPLIPFKTKFQNLTDAQYSVCLRLPEM